MIQRICPICDQVMKSAHYCRTCRHWVKEPWIREVGYYLNERHPQDENNCSYHEPQPEVRREPMRQGQTHWSKGKMPGAWPKTTPVNQSQRGPRSGKKTVWPVVVILVIYVFFQILTAGVVSVKDKFSEFFENNDSYDLDLGSYPPETALAGGSYHELEDAAVIEAGDACTCYGHFDISGELLEGPLVEAVQAQGLEVNDIYQYSDNILYDDGDSWYSRVTSIDVMTEGSDTYQYVEINSDTATGDLHEVSVSLEDGSHAAAVADAVIRYLESEGAIPKDLEVSGALMSDVRSVAASGDDGEFIFGFVEIRVYTHTDGCSIYISHTGD